MRDKQQLNKLKKDHKLIKKYIEIVRISGMNLMLNWFKLMKHSNLDIQIKWIMRKSRNLL